MKKLMFLIAIFGLCFAVGCGVGAQSSSAPKGTLFSEEPAKVAFTSDRDGDGLLELYFMSWDGTEQTRVPLPEEYSGLVWDPAMSPDGTRIVFSYYGPDHADLYTVNTDGSKLKALTKGANSYSPRFSPDGTKITFVRLTDDYVPHIWLMDSDGNHQADITNASITGYDSADFSADGTKIIACRDSTSASGTRMRNRYQTTAPRPAVASGEPGHDIVTMNLNGTGEVVLASEAAEAGSPQFSADGSSVIFTGQAQQNAIMSETITGHVRTPLTPADSNNYDGLVAGDYIYFVSTRDGNAAVYRMNADGSNSIRLTDPSQYSSLGRAVH